MNIIINKTGSVLLTLVAAGLMAAAPSLAGMQGGSGTGPGSGTSSTMESGSDRQDMVSRSGSRMMDGGNAPMDISSMTEVSTGGLSSGDMTMEVKPVKYKNGRLEVKYYANTHSVSLGRYDLMELSTLEVDGKVYKPVKADRMRGHHAGGRIVFEVPQRPEQFRIVIRDIPKVEERLYAWD
jgi:hypothetical protein